MVGSLRSPMERWQRLRSSFHFQMHATHQMLPKLFNCYILFMELKRKIE